MGSTAEVVVWQADGRVDGRVGYGAPIARRLRAAGMTVAVVPLTRRRPSPEELLARVHVLSGGSTAIDADETWLRATRRALVPVLDRALAGRAAITGICFGAQLIASLLAGRGTTEAHPMGMQAGLVRVRDTDGSAAGTLVSSFHYHHIDRVRLEAVGATVVADSENTAVQAFECGLGVRGVQFHPELSPAELAVTLRVHRALVRRYTVTTASAQLCRSRAAARVEDRLAWSDGAFRRFVEDPAQRQLAAERCTRRSPVTASNRSEPGLVDTCLARPGAHLAALTSLAG